MVSLKDDSEIKPVHQPVTARKEYLSDEDVGDKKNSFRKFVLGAPDYKEQTPLKESSEDLSLLHGLPASMKKLRQMSMDRPKDRLGRTQPLDVTMHDQEESSEVDLNLKFLNKRAMNSNKSIEELKLHKKSASQTVNRKKNPYSKFRNRHGDYSPVSNKHRGDERNVSFERIPKASKQKYRNIAQRPPRAKAPEPEEYLEEEVRSQLIRESYSKQVLRDSEDNSLRQLAPDEQARTPGHSSIRRQQKELQRQRDYLRQKDKFNDSQ